MRSVPSILSILAFFLLFGTQRALAAVNVTVDDTLGNGATRIVYSPSDRWVDGRKCAGCGSKPNQTRNQLYEGTWTDSAFDGSLDTEVSTATLQFNGTAVYIFCVIDVLGDADMLFFIDGHADGEFIRNRSNAPLRYEYNVLVYKNESLKDGPHTVTLQNGRIGGGVVTVLLDYMVYSVGKLPPLPSGSSSSATSAPGPGGTDTPSTSPSTSSSPNNTSIIIGVCSAVGGALIAVIAWLLHRFLARKKQREETLRRADPFNVYPRGPSDPSDPMGPGPERTANALPTQTSMSSLGSPKAFEAGVLTSRASTSGMSSTIYTVAPSTTTPAGSSFPITPHTQSPAPRSNSSSSSREPSTFVPQESSIADSSTGMQSSPLRRPFTWDESAMVYTEPPPSYS